MVMSIFLLIILFVISVNKLVSVGVGLFPWTSSNFTRIGFMKIWIRLGGFISSYEQFEILPYQLRLALASIPVYYFSLLVILLVLLI